jgi:hypothetical protein
MTIELTEDNYREMLQQIATEISSLPLVFPVTVTVRDNEEREVLTVTLSPVSPGGLTLGEVVNISDFYSTPTKINPPLSVVVKDAQGEIRDATATLHLEFLN